MEILKLTKKEDPSRDAPNEALHFEYLAKIEIFRPPPPSVWVQQ